MNTKNENEATKELNLITAYVQMVLHTLNKSGTEITPKAIREETKMFYKKFGNNEVMRLATLIIKEKKKS